mmetsp:Transcript_83888/g.218520  ORF Transcript_83888/g.218520 Transcript_83888/m.218520 type:complete len:248 (-) Transcript_83888:105-848(-)
MKNLAHVTGSLFGPAMLSESPTLSPADPFSSTLHYGKENMTLADLERVAELRHNLLERQTVYSYCASYYGKWYYVLTIPSIVITTAVSVLGAVWPYDGDAATAGRVTISLLGALATVITAMQALFRFQSRMDIFYTASSQVDGMVTRLRFLTKYRMGEKVSRNELQGIISGIEDKLNEVRTNVPPIPNSLWLAGCNEEDRLIEVRSRRAQFLICPVGKSGSSSSLVAPDPDSPKASPKAVESSRQPS